MYFLIQRIKERPTFYILLFLNAIIFALFFSISIHSGERFNDARAYFQSIFIDFSLRSALVTILILSLPLSKNLILKTFLACFEAIITFTIFTPKDLYYSWGFLYFPILIFFCLIIIALEHFSYKKFSIWIVFLLFILQSYLFFTKTLKDIDNELKLIKYRNDFEKAQSQSNLALKESSELLCLNIKDPTYGQILIRGCVAEIAIREGDASACDRVGNNSIENQCYTDVADYLKNPLICEKIDNLGIKWDCIGNLLNAETFAQYSDFYRKYCTSISEYNFKKYNCRNFGINNNSLYVSPLKIVGTITGIGAKNGVLDSFSFTEAGVFYRVNLNEFTKIYSKNLSSITANDVKMGHIVTIYGSEYKDIITADKIYDDSI